MYFRENFHNRSSLKLVHCNTFSKMYFNQSSSRINSINNRNFKPEYQITANDDICGDYCHNFERRYKRHDSKKIAALKIFAFLILQRWRKTKTELKDLNQSLKHLRKSVSI